MEDTIKFVRIRYVDKNGLAHDLEAKVGDTLMAIATGNLIAGIGGDCGGNCACGTCRIRLDPHIAQRLHPPADGERELLAFLGEEAPDQRLGCQIPISHDFNGTTIVVVDTD